MVENVRKTIMTPKKGTDHKRPAALNKERILRAAIALADKNGIESLSMRKLAQELGFEVMSLYNHVSNKEEILDAIVDLVASEIEPPSSDAEWKAAMRQSSDSAHKVLLQHPWAARLWWTTTTGNARLVYQESLLRRLREAGFSVELTYHAYHALTMHIVGFTIQELSIQIEKGDLAALAAKFLGETATDEYPNFVEHVMQHVEGSIYENEFEFVLNLLLDGLDRARNT
jgi:AcrR family transcriptional regulator